MKQGVDGCLKLRHRPSVRGRPTCLGSALDLRQVSTDKETTVYSKDGNDYFVVDSHIALWGLSTAYQSGSCG